MQNVSLGQGHSSLLIPLTPLTEVTAPTKDLARQPQKNSLSAIEIYKHFSAGHKIYQPRGWLIDSCTCTSWMPTQLRIDHTVSD